MKKYLNNQLYQECQLITVLNINEYLGGTHIGLKSNEYKKLIKLGHGEYGTIISIEKIWEELKIKPIRHFDSHFIWEQDAKLRLPAELSLWHKKIGLHSVAVIDKCSKSRAIRVMNFRQETTDEGWMFFEDIYKFLILNPDKELPRWKIRILERIK